MLLVINVAIAGRLFFVEYLPHFNSVEPIFFAIAKTIRERWPVSGWWELSNFGYPFAYAYQPLLHHLVAACASFTGWTEARAYHALTCVFYVLGPVSLYALMLRLTRTVGVSFAAALFYSLVSPAALVLRSVYHDAGWQIRRLHVALVYGEGPNIAGLALLPLAILLLDRARERRTVGSWFVASLALVSVPLTNVPATLALGMALVAYGLACAPREWVRVGAQIGAACASGFFLLAPWLQPSGLLLAFHNTQLFMDPEARFAWAKLPYYAAFAVLIAVACWAVHRLRLDFALRFAVLFTAICAPIPMLKEWGGVSLISEANRFHLAMEIPVAIGVAMVAFTVFARARIFLIALAVFGGGFLTVRAAETARGWTEPATLENRPEAKISAWMDEYAGTDRVFVSGSISFWLNYLSRSPQVLGCCNQNLMVPIVPHAHYTIGTFPVPDSTDISVGWFQIWGVRYAAINGPASLEPYRGFQRPKMFDGVLQELWRDGDDAIYEVPLVSASLAHVVKPEELIAREPENGIDVEPVAAYRAAVLDASRPQAAFRFTSPSDAVVEGSLPQGFLYSLQIAYHKGWRASNTVGESVPIGRDALGFMTLAPRCDGPCEVRLHFDGGLEVWVLRGLCGVAWFGLGLVVLLERKMR